MDRLYIIVCNDLPAGAQIAQSCHAQRAFAEAHPDLDRAWYQGGNNLVVLQIENEESLLALETKARAIGIPVSIFREPDFGGRATALAMGAPGRGLVSCLPLALRATARTDRAA